jgi:predicted nuclease of predicted toxin-antitoxin system
LKLLVDQNLSPWLCQSLRRRFPDSVHVREIGLARSSDADVWDYAARHGFAILTKDADFRQRSFLRGHPPKVIWVRLGNCSTGVIEELFNRHLAELEEFVADPQKSFFALR